ncbi:MAG TPA: MarR family transcriptional regulator [Flavobacteriales bacterium]|nr:MarR family transcriptional regulator [Flavobacteriales bacterium]
MEKGFELPLGKFFYDLTRSYAGTITKRLEHIGLDRHYSLLLTINAGNGGYMQQDLCELLNIDKATMVRNLDFLTEKKLIKRITATEDRRQHRILLTDHGRKAVTQIVHAVSEMNKIAFKDISLNKQKEFYVMMQMIANNLKYEPAYKVVIDFKNLGEKRKAPQR